MRARQERPSMENSKSRGLQSGLSVPGVMEGQGGGWS